MSSAVRKENDAEEMVDVMGFLMSIVGYVPSVGPPELLECWISTSLAKRSTAASERDTNTHEALLLFEQPALLMTECREATRERG